MQPWCRWQRVRAHKTDISHRDVTIAWDDETGDKVQVTSHTGSTRRTLGISKKVKELKNRRRTRRFDFWGSLRRDEFARHGCRTRKGPDEEAGIKWLCLSPYVETFNSKILIRFRTLTKKTLRVFEFRDSCVLRYVYMLPTFDVHFTHLAHCHIMDMIHMSLMICEDPAIIYFKSIKAMKIELYLNFVEINCTIICVNFCDESW